MIRQAAEEYAQLGYKVFPLAPGQKRPHGGLAPHGVRDATDDANVVRRWFSREQSPNLGLSCAGLIVIDCDYGNTWPGYERLKAENHVAVQKTPSGGMHFLFRCPDGKSWNNSQGRLAEKIDTRGDGGYIVVAPSKTVACAVDKTSAGDYVLKNPLPPLAELPYPPNWLIGELDRCFASKQVEPIAPPPLPTVGSMDIVDRARAYLDVCEPAISGQGGHNKTFVVAQSLVNGFCLEPEMALRLLLENYNPRCNPPWTERELQHKVDSALKNPSDKPIGWLRDDSYENLREQAKADISGIVNNAQQAESTEAATDDEDTQEYKFTRIDLIGRQPPDWLLHGMLERNTLAVVFGDPGCGKTFLALDWAARIATGTPWRGHDVNAARVFYVAGEGEQGLGRRADAWEQHNGVTLAGAPLFVGPAAAITDTAQLAKLISAIDAEGTPALIVFDTLARCFGGGDENSTKDMGRFVAACDLLRKHYKCTVLIVHHTGHADKNRARGSGALNAALDAEYRLNRWDSRMLLTATKMKDTDAPEPLNINLVTVDLPNMNDDYGNPVTSATIDVISADVGAIVSKSAADDEQQRLERNCQQVIGVLEANPEGASKTQIRETAGLNGANAQRAIDSLVTQKHIYECELIHPGNKRPFRGYRLTDKISNKKSALYCGAEDVVGGGVATTT